MCNFSQRIEPRYVVKGGVLTEKAVPTSCEQNVTMYDKKAVSLATDSSGIQTSAQTPDKIELSHEHVDIQLQEVAFKQSYTLVDHDTTDSNTVTVRQPNSSLHSCGETAEFSMYSLNEKESKEITEISKVGGEPFAIQNIDGHDANEDKNKPPLNEVNLLPQNDRVCWSPRDRPLTIREQDYDEKLAQNPDNDKQDSFSSRVDDGEKCILSENVEPISISKVGQTELSGKHVAMQEVDSMVMRSTTQSLSSLSCSDTAADTLLFSDHTGLPTVVSSDDDCVDRKQQKTSSISLYPVASDSLCDSTPLGSDTIHVTETLVLEPELDKKMASPSPAHDVRTTAAVFGHVDLEPPEPKAVFVKVSAMDSDAGESSITSVGNTVVSDPRGLSQQLCSAYQFSFSLLQFNYMTYSLYITCCVSR